MAEMSKLQIRAKVLSVISEIKTTKHFDAQIFYKFKEELSVIEDLSSLFDIYIKEYIKLEENEYTFAGILLKDLIDKEFLEEKVYKCLESKAYTDESKYKLVQLLRLSGNRETYDSLPLYFDNPEEIMDKETQHLLEKAAYNPESMLDFLDFIYSVQDNDKTLLVNSLQADYNGDNLANIVYPILYSDFKDDFKHLIIDLLTASKSSLGLAPLSYLVETSNNEQLKSIAQKAIKELKLAGATEKKADLFFSQIIEASNPSCFFATIPDGEGNQAILTTRVKDDDSIIFIAVVINDKLGVIDCFGFYNISVEESCRIITKFYKSEGKYKISPQYAKLKIDEAVKKTIENKRLFPYEFICWNVFFRDLEAYKYSVDSLVKSLKQNDDISADEVINVLTKDYTIRWFIDIYNNKSAKEMFDKIYKLEKYDINEINSIIKLYIDTVFDSKQQKLWECRLTELVHLLDVNNKEDDALLFLAILRNETFFNTFKGILLQRTVFNNAIRIKQDIKTKNEAANIFSKNNEIKEEYDIKIIDKLIKELQKNWIYG